MQKYERKIIVCFTVPLFSFSMALLSSNCGLLEARETRNMKRRTKKLLTNQITSAKIFFVRFELHKIIWGYSSAGRALEWHSRGQRFDPAYLHQNKTDSQWLSVFPCYNSLTFDSAVPLRKAPAAHTSKAAGAFTLLSAFLVRPLTQPSGTYESAERENQNAGYAAPQCV